MTIDPVLVKVIGGCLALLITVLGYFLNRTITNQDNRYEKQSETNKKLNDSINTLNSTMVTLNEGFKWMKEGCAERHILLNNRLNSHSKDIKELKEQSHE